MQFAANKAAMLAAQADSSAEISGVVRANTKLSSTLAEIAVDAAGGLESRATAALVEDLHMQQDLLKKTIEMSGRVGGDVERALEGAVSQQRDTCASIAAAAELDRLVAGECAGEVVRRAGGRWRDAGGRAAAQMARTITAGALGMAGTRWGPSWN